MSTNLFQEDTARLRGEILQNLHHIKHGVEFLLNRDFFKFLLDFYKELEGFDGIPQWMELYTQYLEDPNCSACTSGKMKLMESLIFTLHESELLGKIDKLQILASRHEDLKEAIQEYSEI